MEQRIMLHYGDWLSQWNARTPLAEAIYEPETGRRFTYAHLYARVNRLVHALQAAGVKRGDRVAVLAQNCAEQFECLFACLKLGAIHVPYNWRLSSFELQDVNRDAAPAVLLCDAEFAETAHALTAGRTVQFGGAYESWLETQPAGEPTVTPSSMEDIAIILYTSGTTGRPKGAMLPVRQLIFNSIQTDLAVGLGAEDSTLVFLPLFHTGGLNCLATPLFHRGGRVMLLKKFDPDRVCQLTQDEHITAHMGVPTTFESVAASPLFHKTDFSSVRFMLVGGAPCPLQLLETYKARGLSFRQGFGMTEVGPNDFSLPPDRVFEKMGSIGLTNAYLSARLVDDQGHDVPVGDVGELVLSGPVVCAGYFRNDAATASALRDGWFYTGDLARRDAEGFYFIVDRKKDMFISGGENVYPAEVEAVLLLRPEIAECAVLGIPDQKWGEVGRAVVVVKPGHTLSEETLLGHCKQRLARYKVPKDVVFTAALPRNPTGKIVKPKLKELFGK